MTEDYVSFETAKLLKEKGANFDTDLVYAECEGTVKTSLVHIGEFNYWGAKNITKKPSISLAMKWLRIEHNIHIEILMTNHSMSERFDIPKYYWVAINAKTCKWITESTVYSAKQFDTNKEACEAAIKYCLTNLI